MISVYVHIPFCIKKCNYCDFYSVPFSDSLALSYIEALGKEWEMYLHGSVLNSQPVHTVYIGGGTPSLLTVDMWKKLDEALFSKFDKSEIKEWSVECNPESFTIEKADVYADSGVTRLTFGVQSLNSKELSICGRAHSADRAFEVINYKVLNEKFHSVGIDIIYSLPEQTLETLDSTLSTVLSVPAVKHLSAYELTVADYTPFGRNRQKLSIPTEELSVEMYELINKRCSVAGMRQYEVSNYALSGHESIHNKAYWSHKPYIGLGASAHSYIHPKRWSNVSDAESYISKISAGKRAVDFEETLGPREIASEIVFLGLRSVDGVDEEEFTSRTGLELCDDGREKILMKYVDLGLLEKRNNLWIPTSKGMLFADMMARELM
ncbi:MAG: radical SAM family heme chaperone HemW [Chitinispirillales bacterium]|nr:radical SAM family heme chaperone HemW [Chitinispirillales bacterium]